MSARPEDYEHLTSGEYVAVKGLEEYVRKLLASDMKAEDVPKLEVTAYTHRDERGGLRISELSYFVRERPGEPYGGGGSWMASEVEAGGVLFAAERFLLSYHEPVQEVPTWESTLDFKQETETRLWFAITGEWPAWDERPATHLHTNDGPVPL